ncbi:MAG: IS200/IS605 family transposase [Candidatus Omnitrophota bacterium]|nr:IS200/IS605 family transposase [Candidatus Omnitrophota bacterium]
MARYWKGAHTRHKLQYHLVWVPKYRKRVLRGKIAYRLKGLLYDGCKVNRWWLGKISIQDDHVHLLLQLQASDSIAEAVRMLKGGTSRIIRKEFPELEEFLWGDSFWADGYFAESVGHVDEEVIKKYIDEQRK